MVLLLQELLLLNLAARLGGGSGTQRAYWLGELLSEWYFTTATPKVVHLSLGHPLRDQWMEDLATADILDYCLDWAGCGCPETTSCCCHIGTTECQWHRHCASLKCILAIELVMVAVVLAQ